MKWRRSTLWKITAGEYQRRPGRTLLTLFGIVIGVAATVAISICIQTTRQAHRDMFEVVTGRAALEVVAEGLTGFDPGVSAQFKGVSGIKAVVPVIQTPTALVGKSGAVPVMALGVVPEKDTAARDYVLFQGQLLGKEEGVLLEKGFAQSQGIDLGSTARFLTPSGLVALPVQGLLEARGAATFNGGAVAFMPLFTAQRLFNLANQINGLQLVLESDTNQKLIEEALAKQLPPGLIVQSPGSRAELGRAGMAPTEQGLATMSASSLVTGAMVILNAFLMNLGERRRQLALLRALGATRGQVTRILLREAAMLGIAGTILGIALGLALSGSLRRTIGQLMAVTLPELRLTIEPILVALAVGPGMALAATLIPARRAARRAPLEDLLQKGAGYAEEFQRWPSYLGIAMLAGLCLILHGILYGWLEPHLFIHVLPPAMAMYLIG
ncbi:MAG TPA: FtsX-like permease family protein, partial [Gemmataceae bacterium]|nr:FtsX-like permease family protein [Gemmataceae bacterium]